MICKIKVENGMIRLPPELKVPDGVEVQLTLPDPADAGSFADRYGKFIGIAEDMPSDLAENLDHYLHGTGKA